jgi:hypothetical protein
VVHPAAALHHDSSAVMYVPHGVQNEASNETWPAGAELFQIVAVAPVAISCRWMPDWPVSNGVKRNRPF